MSRSASTRMVGDPAAMYGQRENTGRLYSNVHMREIALYSQAMMLKSGQGPRDVAELEARFDGMDRVVWGRWVEERGFKDVKMRNGKTRSEPTHIWRFVEHHVYVLPSHQLTADRRLEALPAPEPQDDIEDEVAAARRRKEP